MDLATWGAISTVLVMVAFFGVCFWAFSPKLKNRFEDDANLPFADEIKNKQTDDQVHQEERK